MKTAAWPLLFLMAAASTMAGCAPPKPSAEDVDMYLKARDLYLRGAVDQARPLVAQIGSRARAFHQARLLEGKVLFFDGNMEEAQRTFQELVDRFPGYTEALIWLLRTLQIQRKQAEAEELLDRALEVNPGDPRLLHIAGLLRLGADDINGALGFFRRSEEFGTELAQSYIESARILYRFGLIDAALADLAVAKALLPSDSGMRKPVEDLAARVREAGKEGKE